MNELSFLEKKLQLVLPSKIINFKTASSEQQKITIFLKRDDLIHTIVSGNKWRKLKYNLINVLDGNISQIISFGGAWSNHLHALSWCCKQLGIEFIAIIRGEPGAKPSSMISDISAWGTKIKWLSRAEYRLKNEPEWLQKLQKKYPRATIIPEGGSNQVALKGVQELAEEIDHQVSQQVSQQDSKQQIGMVDYVCAAVGSGGTLAGLVQGFQKSTTRVIGIPVVKGVEALRQRVTSLLDNSEQNNGKLDNWQLIDGYEVGGYARYDSKVAAYIKDFKEVNDIILEPVYTAKLLIAVEDLINKQFFKPGSNIVVIHSGGVQGLRGATKFNLHELME